MSRSTFTAFALFTATNGACSSQPVFLPAVTAGQRTQTTDSTIAPPPAQPAHIDPAANAPILLTWNKPTRNVSAYRLYLAQNNKSTADGNLLQTINFNVGAEVPTSFEIPLAALNGKVISGKKTCFYLVAEFDGFESFPSDISCFPF